MIPSTLHYCWFGGKPLPDSVKQYINGWRRLCPAFSVKQWDESNFPIDDFRYAREAYQAGKFAFVSDVARLYALFLEGGIYLDTDVELLRPLDDLLHSSPAFLGFERERHASSATHVATCVIGAEKGCRFAADNLEPYRTMSFFLPDGRMDTTTNVERITEYMKAHGLIIDNTCRHLPGIAAIFPYEYFCPWKRSDLSHTYAIHHYAGSWLLCNTPEYVRLRQKYRIIPYFIRKKLILALLGYNTRGFFPTLVHLTHRK